MEKLKSFFKFEENKTTFGKEVLGGATTFLAMAYILFVNPDILTIAGDGTMPRQAIFLATILATVVGTLIMALVANVPYALAPGMGLNAFFTYTVCGAFGFSWQQGLGMVFICGIINILITVTKIRKHIIKAIPRSLQSAIGAGIGLFIAYIALHDTGIINTTKSVPALGALNNPTMLIAIFSIVLTIILMVLKVPGAILIGIGAATIVSVVVSIATGASEIAKFSISPASWGEPFVQLGSTFGQAFLGIGSLFSDATKIPMALLAIFAFSLTDTFDTIGTFVGTGRKSGIFDEEDEKALESGSGFTSKMDKAMFADSIATSIGAIFGTSNTTTYIESAAGIEAGARTGFASVITAGLFLLCILIAPVAQFVTFSATAGALFVVGILMATNLKEVNWSEFDEAVPCFFAAVIMVLSYNISNGIAFGFIMYCIVKTIKGRAKDVHPILWVSTALFVVYFVFEALRVSNVF